MRLWGAFVISIGVSACGNGHPSAPVAPNVATAASSRATTPLVCTKDAPIHVTVSSAITNETGRPSSEIDGIVRRSLDRKLATTAGLVLASGAPVPGRCEVVIKVAARPFVRGKNGTLRVTLSLGVHRRSDDELLGTVDKTLTEESVAAEDVSSEIKLLTLAADGGAEAFASNAHAITDDEVRH